jgi:uncharacterized membrane protein YagU involved in acid resistance
VSTSARPAALQQVPARLVGGVIAGLAGGVVFGMLMAMMGMLPMIAMLVGSSSALVGAGVHLVISAGIGAVFGLLAPHTGWGGLLAAGAVYGMAWWVLGPLVLMPAMTGMPLLVINMTAVASLLGHVIYGLVTAAVLAPVRRRAGA